MIEWLVSAEGQVFIGYVGATFIGIGGFGKWIIARMDAKAEAHSKSEAEARAKLEKALMDRIDDLERELADTKRLSGIYLRRIFHLEAHLDAHGLDAPITEGWPP